MTDRFGTCSPAQQSIAAGRRRTVFSAALLGRSTIWTTTDLLLAWFLHRRFALNGWQTGLAAAGLLFLGGIATLIVGRVIAAHRSDVNHLIRIQFAGAVATSLCFVVQFTTHDLTSALVAAVALRFSYAGFDVAQNAVSSLLPINDDDASRYATLRVAASSASRIAMLLIFWMLDNDPSLRATLCVLIAAVFATVSSAALLPMSFPDHGDRLPTAAYMIPDVPHPRLLPLLAAACLATLALPLHGRLLLFVPNGSWSHLGGWLLGGLSVGTILAPLTWRRWESALGVPLTLGASVALAAIGVLVHGVSTEWPAIRVGAAILQGYGIAMISSCMWIAVANAARYLPHEDAPRQDAAVFAKIIATLHFSAAAGALILGRLIDSFSAERIVASASGAIITTSAAAAIAILLARSPYLRT